MDILQILRFPTKDERIHYVPSDSELVFEQTSNRLYLGDGATAGGILLHLHDSFVELPEQKAGACLATDGEHLLWENSIRYTFTPIMDADYTARNLEYVRTDSSHGSCSITLPPSAVDYDRIIIHDVTESSGTHPVTLSTIHSFGNGSSSLEVLPRSLVECTFYKGQWAVNQGGCRGLEAEYQYVKTWVFPISAGEATYTLTDGQLPSANHDEYALYMHGKENQDFTVDTITNTMTLTTSPTESGIAQLKFWCTRPAKEVHADTDVSPNENFYFTQTPDSLTRWEDNDKNSRLSVLTVSPFTLIGSGNLLKKLLDGRILLWGNDVASDNYHSNGSFFLGTLNTTTNTVSWVSAGKHPTDQCHGLIAQFGNGQLIMGGGFAGTTSANAVPSMYLGTISGNKITWTQIADSAGGKFHDVYNGNCTLHDGRVLDLYSLYGNNGVNYSHYGSRIFSVKNNEVTTVEQETPFPCAGLSVTQLPDKRLLVMGTVPHYTTCPEANKSLCYFGTINTDSSITWEEGKSGINATFAQIIKSFDSKFIVFKNDCIHYAIGTLHGNTISWVQNKLPVRIEGVSGDMKDGTILSIAPNAAGALNTTVFKYCKAMRRTTSE